MLAPYCVRATGRGQPSRLIVRMGWRRRYGRRERENMEGRWKEERGERGMREGGKGKERKEG